MSKAFSSVDRMSSGLLSGLAGPNIDFAKTEDGKRLIARLRLPPTPNKEGEDAIPPKLSVAVLGRSHLRVKLNIKRDGFQSISEHTYGLPAYVSSEGVAVTPQDDGTVHVSLRILKEANAITNSGDGENESLEQKMGSFMDQRIRNPLFPILIHRDSREIDSDDEVVEELPRPEEVDRCRAQHANDKMLRKECICDITRSSSARAVCYGSLISKAVSVARRLGMHDFATNAKHHAIECADGHTDAVECLQRVASELLASLHKKDAAAKSTVEDRVRAAIESEDDGPSNFGPSYGTVVSFLLIVFVVAMFIYGALWYIAAKLSGSPQTTERAEILAELVSRQAGQVKKSLATFRGPFQGASTSPKLRVSQKVTARSKSGDSKLA